MTTRFAKIGIIIGVGAIALAILSLILLNSLRISFFSVSGNSMAPTFHDKDSIVLKQGKKLEKDQIVFFTRPEAWSYSDEFSHEPTILIKRVSAVKGDTLTFDGKAFSINGELFYDLEANNYECPKAPSSYSHKLTTNEVFVTGDNALHSLDSRRAFCDGKSSFFVRSSKILDYGEAVLVF